MRTHTKFDIKKFEIDILMIFDLLNSPQGHQFDPRVKMLLLVIPVDLICHMTMFDDDDDELEFNDASTLLVNPMV